MGNLDELYCEVPPTKLRKKDERFRPARTSPFWLWVADRFFYGMLENRFYAFRYKGFEKFQKENNTNRTALRPRALASFKMPKF